MNAFRRLLPVLFAATFLVLPSLPSVALAQSERVSIADRIDQTVAPVAAFAAKVVFFGVEVREGVVLPIVLAVLGGTAIFLTFYFRFINFRAFGVAIRTARGRYVSPDAPGEITHFQALTAALSATVGLGNIAGVAVAIGLGGPGATFWMIVMGLCGMTTKFAECTLGVKYRRIDAKGKVRGGAMYYLRDGLRDTKLAPVGTVLAVLFAVFVIGGAFGAGNMFQSNQAFSQFSSTFLDSAADDADGALKLTFGIVFAVLVGMVIIGGIVRIARVTAFLVPFMCGIYVITALFVILTNLGLVIPALQVIVTSAFSNEAVAGGLVGILIQGIRRAAFSNEAGLGSAPIAHSAVKTDKPASEGFVSLLEPFVDTVVVCTMTALVIVITGTWRVSGETTEATPLLAAPGSAEVLMELPPGQYLHLRNAADEAVEVIGLVSKEDRSFEEVEGWVDAGAVTSRRGVPVTSMAFATVLPWFPAVLAIAVILFAFSTMISWSYYGEQGVIYLFSGLGEAKLKVAVLGYKLVFCFLVVVGASSSLGNILDLSDSMVFAMVLPNLIGLYLLLPVVKKEMRSYLEHVETVDAAGKRGTEEG